MRRAPLAGLLIALACAGCGLNVQSPDLFVLTKTGERSRLAMLVNDAGTISCNGARAKPLPDQLLLQARDLVNVLDSDAKAGLRIASGRQSVYRYTIKLQDGTIEFPDVAGGQHSELSQAELFALRAQIVCG